jgi:predicted nucleic acid-binding protein
LITAVDANVLIKWSHPKTDALDRARLELMLDVISKAGGKVIIPTPCLAEFLVATDEATSEWLQTLERKRSVVVAAFDRRAAFECALLDSAAIRKGDKKGGRQEPWQKIKIDRQIVGVARVNNATTLITDDEGLRSTALAAGLTVYRLRDLDVPESAKQLGLDLQPKAAAGKDAPAG